MAPPGTNVDDPDNVRRFLAQIGGSSQGSNGINSSTASSALGGSSEMPPSSQSRAMNTADQGLNGIARGPLSDSTTVSELRSRAGSLTDDQFRTAIHNLMQSSRDTTSMTSPSPVNALDESLASTAVTNHGSTNGVLHHQSNPIDIPPRVSSSHDTPLSGSPDLHPHPSPNAGGLAPPYNTPQTRASSPRFGPNNTHNEDVADALAEWVEGLEGRPLSESMWAPRNGHPPSLLSGLRPGSRNLTPIAVVQPNLATNDSISRIPSRAVNSHPRVSGNIIGEHNVRPSRLQANAPPRVIPAAPLFSSLENNKSDSESQPTPPAPDIKVTDFVHTITKKENMSASTNKTASVPPHLRGKDQGPQPGEDSHATGMDKTTKSLTKDLTEVETSATSSEPLQAAPQTEMALKPETQADKGSSSVATGASDSPDETRQKIIWHIEALESSGYLSAEAMTTLRGVRDTIVARATGKTEDDFILPAKTYYDPARSIQMQMAMSPIETAGKATVKPGVSEVSKPQADHTSLAGKSLDKLVMRTKQPSTSQRNAPSPTTPIYPTGLSSAEVRKILKNAPASPAQTPSKAPGSLASAESTATGQTTPAALSPSNSTKSGDTIKADSSPSASAAGNTIAVGDSREKTEDREHKAYFATWGKQEDRDRPAAKVRKVIIKDLPHNATPTFVAGLIYGGAVEEIHIRSSAAGALTAAVRFMNAEECEQYYDETSNGIVYKKDSQNREMVVYVDLAKDVDVVGGLLQDWIEAGFTRCVRAVGADEDWDLGGLKKMAESKGRKIEGIQDSKNAAGARSVIFRFCKIEDAVQFKNALVRDDEWEHCNIHYANDPCATATGLHFD